MTVPHRIRSDHVTSAHIHYFSGTGNTARAAELIAAELRSAGYAVTLYRVGRDASPSGRQASSVEPEALRVFCFPIYACGIPSIIANYLRRLKGPVPARGLSPKPRAAVVCTIGDAIWHDKTGKRHHLPGFEGHALMQAAGILKRRGYDVILTDACSYPLNWTQMVNAPRPEIDAELRALGDSQASEVGKRIAAGECSIRRFNKAHMLWSVPFDWLYRFAGRFGMGKLYVADGGCNACGLCIRGCPARAVRLAAKRPRWGWNCEGCERCINTCPKKAIQTSWARLAAEAIHALIPIPFLIWRLGPHPWVPVRPVLIEVFSWLGVYVAAMWLLDVLLFGLELVPGVRRLFQWSLTKNFRRYLEPHFRP